MTSQVISAEEVESRLSSVWEVQEDGQSTIYGYLNGYSSRRPLEPKDVPASFTVRYTPDLDTDWMASIAEPSTRRGGLHESVDCIRDSKDEAIDWIVSEAGEY